MASLNPKDPGLSYNAGITQSSNPPVFRRVVVVVSRLLAAAGGTFLTAAVFSDSPGRFDSAWMPYLFVIASLFIVGATLIELQIHFGTRWRRSRMSWVLVFIVSGAAGVAAFWLGGRNPPESLRPVERTWDTESQQLLLQRISPFGRDEASVKVLFARSEQRVVAEEIVSTFTLGGWKTNRTVVPLGTWLHDAGYFDGVEIQGYNRMLVQSIASAFDGVGLGEVRTKIDDLHVPESNPKWSWANRRVRITLGHTTAERPSADAAFGIDKLDETFRQFGLQLDGVSSPQAKPTPENDAGPTEYIPLQDGRFLRVTGASWSSQEREVARALLWIHETEERSHRQ